jgi:hypothetical protein
LRSKTRTIPFRTVTRVPLHSEVVSHSVPIAPADTEPVAVFQLPPVSETHRRRCLFFFFLRFFLAAVAFDELVHPSGGGILNCVNG